jgi:hypothetical protein
MPQAADLPNDVEALKGIILERSTQLEVAEALLISQKLELEKLRFQIAYLKRMKYGRSSEQLDGEHLADAALDRGSGVESCRQAPRGAARTEGTAREARSSAPACRASP